MSLLEDLNHPPKRAMKFAEWLIAQPANVREALDKAAADLDTWSDHALEQTLRKHGAPVSKESIRVWRADVATR